MDQGEIQYWNVRLCITYIVTEIMYNVAGIYADLKPFSRFTRLELIVLIAISYLILIPFFV